MKSQRKRKFHSRYSYNICIATPPVVWYNVPAPLEVIAVHYLLDLAGYLSGPVAVATDVL